MAGIFLKIVNMSISACWIVLVILLFRLVLKKAPKWINCVLWGIAGLRLVMPFSFESVFSLVPSAETITKAPDSPRPQINSGVTVIDNQINDYLKGNYFEGVTRPVGNFVDISTIFAIIWIVGIAALLIYTLISFLRLKNKIGTAVLLRNNIYQSETVVSPFVLGIIRPKMYLPFNISGQEMDHVIAHEQAHIRRKDHLWKPLGFLILTLHWFNPIIWLGYILLCRDIELACDEKVVKELNNEQRADYSEALLACSVNRRMIAACPLAFGEVGVKDRIKSVLNYKKPAFWIIIVAIIVSITVAVCFLTNPLNSSVYNSRYETGKCLYSYVVSADKETKSNELVFDITSDGKAYKTFGDGTTEELGVLKKSDYTAEELEAAIKNQDDKLNIGTIKTAYELSDYVFLQKSNGTVYLVQFFSDGRIMSVFKLNRINKNDISNGSYKLSKEIYFNGAYSYVTDLKNDSIEIKTKGGMHVYHFIDKVLSTGGLYKEVHNKKDLFTLFSCNSEFSVDENLKALLKNNKEAWYDKPFDNINAYPYILMSQKDGTLFIVFADFENGEPTRLRYIYELKYKSESENADYTSEENTTQNDESRIYGSFENPYKLGDTVRMKHGDEQYKHAAYDYNFTLTEVLTGSDAKEKLKELCLNYEEEKSILEEYDYDLYLANVIIKYNETSEIKEHLPFNIGVLAIGTQGKIFKIDNRFNILPPDNCDSNGEWNCWYSALAPKDENVCIAFGAGSLQNPGIFSAVCFEVP